MRRDSRAIRRREARRTKEGKRKANTRFITSIREATTPEEMLRRDPTIFRRGLAEQLRVTGARIPKGTTLAGKIKKMWDAFYRIQRDRIFIERLLSTRRGPSWNEEVETLLRQRARLTQLHEACMLNQFLPVQDCIEALEWATGYARFRLTQLKRVKKQDSRAIERMESGIELFLKRIGQLKQLTHLREIPGRGLNDTILSRRKGRREWTRIDELYEGRLPKGVPLVRAETGWFTSALNSQLEGRITTILGPEIAQKLKADERWAADSIYKLM